MTALVVAMTAMAWAWFLRARNLDRRDREQGGNENGDWGHDGV